VAVQDLKLAARFAANLHSQSDRRRFFTDYFCFFKSPADLHHQASSAAHCGGREGVGRPGQGREPRRVDGQRRGRELASHR
jgi:hypothetical protein